MAKICSQCNKEWPDEFSVCPLCGGVLVEKSPETSPTFNLKLGDANAVDGGIHMSDSHAVDSHDVHNETHNITNNTWITQPERNKTFEEIQQEREKEFRDIVRNVYEDGRVTADEFRTIKFKATELGLDQAKADDIIRQEQSFVYRRVKDRPLDEDEYNLIKIVQSCIRANDREGLLELVDDLKNLNANIDNGQVQFFYYMLLAALKPEEFIQMAETNKVSIDSFWRTVWLSVAYLKVGSRRPPLLDFKYRQYMSSRDNQFPGNIELASGLYNLKESLTTKSSVKASVMRDSAKAKIKLFESDHQSYLDELGFAITAVLDKTSYPLESKFYMDCFFGEVVQPDAAAQAKRQRDEEIFLPLSDIPRMPKIGLFHE